MLYIPLEWREGQTVLVLDSADLRNAIRRDPLLTMPVQDSDVVIGKTCDELVILKDRYWVW